MAEALDTEETRVFDADVGRILDIVAHALYSEREVFLRELIANAADACDKRRFLAQTDEALAEGAGDPAVTLVPDAGARTLTVSDTGVGMNRDELIANLGTIARSGTAEFAKKLSGDAAKDGSLIGQFGVGFYSAFMVADEVVVETRRLGEPQGWRWTSDGRGGYRIEAIARDAVGTDVILRLKEDAAEFLDPWRLKAVVKRWSDPLALPIRLDPRKAEGGKEDEGVETINAAQALWTRPKAEIEPETYTAFYRDISHAFDEPWAVIHNRNEGTIEYTNLLFIPTERPADLYEPERKPRLRLHVRRMFITDDCEALLPGWLRFLRGVVDSADLPLNVSREMLQNTPLLTRIRQGLVKRVLGELEGRAKSDAEGYARFWDAFGAVVKEGLYEDFENRDRLLGLARFRSTAVDGWTSLADYVARMKPEQKAIYVMVGDSVEAARVSPQLEGFKARGLEVLLLGDPIDGFWTMIAPDFDGKPIRAVGRVADDELAAFPKVDADGKAAPETKDEAAEGEAGIDGAALADLIGRALGDRVRAVRPSARLVDSPACLAAGSDGPDPALERLLARSGRGGPVRAPILEINPDHALLKALKGLAAEAGEDAAARAAALAEPAELLLDQARLAEGEAPADPAAFARRLAQLMTRAYRA
ncbi:molecular chaperone HtpG [Tistrella sp.]|uniref:molecular chaperone HtpG n=1 Tax=Tistrella sp. TaxID=2024861 RepID=UPI000C8A1936|nr:molecular chaperone HtpG [Tistrella sp.]MAD38133.1 molecular chaperone HtpG [Tistrella sp.]